MKRIIILLLVLLLLFSAQACDSSNNVAHADELTASVTAQELDTVEPTAEQSAAALGFGLSLLREDFSDGNALLSPMSLLLALGMTSNGAVGQTREQMEAVLGMDVDTLNTYLSSYLTLLPQNNSFSSAGKLNAANSVWVREGLTVQDAFLQAAVNYYDAQVFSAPFDKSTVSDINRWVSLHTDGMIDRLLDSVPNDSAMYLLNAIAFDADWQDVYYNTNVMDAAFTTEDGTNRTVSMMYTSERRYFETELATGFLKYYNAKRYAFAALLPNKGITISELLDSLDGQTLYDVLSAPIDIRVDTGLPKFSYEAQTDAKESLRALGMTDAFDPDSADFSGISRSGNLFISRVLHKAYIAVDEKGTRAGAATAAEVAAGATPTPEEFKTVILDRPFVYLILDTKYTTPVFLGVLMDPGE